MAAEPERTAAGHAGSGYAARGHAAKAREEHRAAWVAFHTDMQRLHIQLAEEHAMKAAFLKGDRGGGAYLSGTCTATKRDGSPCTLPSNGPSGLCWAHDPANAERRRRGQSRGGRSKGSREIVLLKTQLAGLYTDVLAGELEPKTAAVAAQIQNVRLRCLEQERRLRELEEIEERLLILERRFGLVR